MFVFPIDDIVDENQAHQHLMDILHPSGLTCPNGHCLPEDQAPHERKDGPLTKYRCKICGCVFTMLSGTLFQGARYSCVQLILLLRGVLQGKPTLHIAKELDIDYGNALAWRHRIQAEVWENKPHGPLPDQETESDETYPNAGEKGSPESEKDNPSRNRGNKARGRGSMESDRPPIVGVAGRESGQISVEVVEHTTIEEIEPAVEEKTQPGVCVYTDENLAYGRLSETSRAHKSVSHSDFEWAKDEDGDGKNEVHDNTIEAVWTEMKNFLRPFKGVHKRYLHQYLAVFEWVYNLKEVSKDFLRLILLPGFTKKPI